MRPIYLLDTNIISELRKPAPNQNVLEKFAKYAEISVISAVTFDEMLFCVKRMEEGRKKDALWEFYTDFVQKTLDIIPFDVHCAWIHSDLTERLERAGKPSPIIDSMIAATAIANNQILVTRNVSDFDSIRGVSNLMIENWFEENCP